MTAGIWSGHEWLVVSEQLAQRYWKIECADDAEAVERELLTLLAVADHDHPIRRRLHDGHGPSR
jgi:hypothetical protein